MVREMRVCDEAQLLQLGQVMHQESAYFSKHEINIDKWKQMCIAALTKPTIACFVYEKNKSIVGMWAGYLSSLWYSDDIKVHDTVLFVHPDHRKGPAAYRLIKASEEWAKLCGAKSATISLSSGIDTESVSCFLSKLNYSTTAIVMEKEIG